MLQTMMKKMRRNSKKGFTLIELIVVIAILAILAAIMVPSMVGYLNSAKKSTADANARTVYSAAASAAAASIAAGTDLDADDSVTDEAVTGLTDAGFETQLANMLGSTFEGVVSVTFDGNGNITETKWKENASASDEETGVYTVGGGSADSNPSATPGA